ncbi:glycosyltransferase family 28 c-terminal domain-containing protein [Cyclospora cayetanensis]|uniref:UDP-N-acetylglucosamine transferase subunit ALG13 n=1 Tax=Cyclospora cayetanensis TaxID=88456 RepID=A0A1D3CTW8_9EIME|nr:glycosyltransferase family 28 c-terminal domain-containing protein [Cyclospora cayetanensis]
MPTTAAPEVADALADQSSQAVCGVSSPLRAAESQLAAAASSRGPSVLVTVGTTSFDELVLTASSEPFLRVLRRIDCAALTFQIGRGHKVPFGISPVHPDLSTRGVLVDVRGIPSVKVVRYITCLAASISAFHLVVSHCGAGTLLEALRKRLKVVACVNPLLLNNHQAELATQLAAGEHCVTLQDLSELPAKTLEAWQRPFAVSAFRAEAAPGEAREQREKCLLPLPPPRRGFFSRIVCEELGLDAEYKSLSLGSATRCLLFAADGRVLLAGDGGGCACMFDLASRRPLSLLLPSEGACIAAAPIGLPFGSERSPFLKLKASKGVSSVLHIEPLLGSSGESDGKVLLQQKDSRISLFDMAAQKFAGAFRTGAFSFCKCSALLGKSSAAESAEDIASSVEHDASEGSSNSSSALHALLGGQCVAAPTSVLESAGLFDLRAAQNASGERRVTPPSLELRLPSAEIRQAFPEREDATSAGSLQGLAFSTSSCPLLLAAYELPSLAMWDLRQPKTPLAFAPLPQAASPPSELEVVRGSRAWIACVEGELQLLRIATKKLRATQAGELPPVSTAQATQSRTSNPTCSSLSAAEDCGGSARSGAVTGNKTEGRKTCLVPVASACIFAQKSNRGRLFEAQSCQEAFIDFMQLETGELHMTSLAVRSDGLVGACGCSDGKVQLYEGKALRPLGELTGHHTAVSATAWCPTNGVLASGDGEGVVHLWGVYRDSYHPFRTAS